MKKVVIVGGGTGGIVAANVLAKRGCRVALIERQAQIGGLFRSYTNDRGQSFDCGTHLVLGTGEPDLDDIILSGLADTEHRSFFESMHEGHYYRGRLYEESGCLDVRALPDDQLATGQRELQEAESSTFGTGLLSDILNDVYGQTFAESAIVPVLEHFTGREIDTLSPSTIDVFGLRRIIAFGEDETRRLKQSPALDAKIAYTSFRHGTSEIAKYYPISGGVGSWISGMERDLVALGVQIMTNARIVGIGESGTHVTHVEFEDGGQIDCDHLIWTTPLAELLYISGREFPSVRPNFLSLTLAHLSTTSPLQTNLHYLNCFDTDLNSFRVTFYPNLIADPPETAPHHLTVEFLGTETSRDREQVLSTAVAELGRMGVVAPDAEYDFMDVQTLPFALPILTPEVEAAADAQKEIATNLFRNLHCVGRSTSSTHFQRDIMSSAYRSVDRMAL